MNAYELAEQAKEISTTIEALEWVQKATPLLRQQADRIVELEKCIEFGYKDAMDIVVLNNLGAEDNHWFVWAKKLVNINYTAPKPIEKPLYTTSQTKPLSNERLQEIYKKVYEEGHDNQVVALCRAIEKEHGIL